MSGTPSWALVAPSRNSTIEWITEPGCTSTSMRRYSTSKRKWASMTSSPLFIMVALSMVTLGPMLQVGWRSASSGVMAGKVAGSRSRKGPPLAVRISRLTLAGSSPRRHCQSAECSLSMGRRRDPDRRERARTISPAMTSTSLVAVATVVPASMAANVGRSAAAPVMATQTTSAGMAASSQAASRPTPQLWGTSIPGSGATTATRAAPKRSASARKPPLPQPGSDPGNA